MRNFFIKSFEAIASIIVVIGVVAIIAGAVSVSQLPQGGIARAIGVLIGGFVYLSLLWAGSILSPASTTTPAAPPRRSRSCCAASGEPA